MPRGRCSCRGPSVSVRSPPTVSSRLKPLLRAVRPSSSEFLSERATVMELDARAPIRILLVDDHAVVRQGLRMLIENNADLSVVGEAASTTEALNLARCEGPDVVLLDLDLGKDSGVDILPELLSLPGVRVLVLTGLRDAD